MSTHAEGGMVMLFEISRDLTTYSNVLAWCRKTLGYEPQIETTLNIFRVFCRSEAHASLLKNAFA
jgi:hypothetical protein